MDLFRRYGNLLRQDGTNQRQRTLPALEPGYILPDERKLSDLVAYAHKLAKQIRYYNLSGQGIGDWSPLFESLLDPNTGQILDQKTLESTLNSRHDWPPHLSLFLVFLKLFQYLQSDLNELTLRHLRHYYETELGLSRRNAETDDVHVIFELAKNATPTLLRAGTLLDAGKDKKGRKLHYATKNDLVISAAAIKDIRRLVVDSDARGFRRFFVADSISEVEGKSWNTFGSKQLKLDQNKRYMREADLGFAIASPVLRLAEGMRTIDVTAQLRVEGDGKLPATQGIGYALKPTLTGEKDWIIPEGFSAKLTNESGVLSLHLHLTISETAPAIVDFDSSLHGTGPVSKWPVLRCLIRGETGIYETLDRLVVDDINIEVGVTGVRNLVVQNTDGPLSTSKPMALFGSQPRIGSLFYIGSEEVFSKKLTYLAFNLKWLSPLENFFEHYTGYFDSPDSYLRTSLQNYFTVDVQMLYERSWDISLVTDERLFSSKTIASNRIYVSTNAFNNVFKNRAYDAQPDLKLANTYTASSSYGFVRLVLRQPTRDTMRRYGEHPPFEAFGHQTFAARSTYQAFALSNYLEPTPPNPNDPLKPAIPNQPYTPELETLSIDYNAKSLFSPNANKTQDKWFVIGPFGYNNADDLIPANLVPAIDGAAALYLGVKNLQAPANLSLLFQIDTGTAKDDILKTGETHWSNLQGSVWQALPPTAILNDSTYGFQKPGLVVVSVPKEATEKHSAMPTGLIWVRAHIDRTPGSASRTTKIYSQAAVSEFAVAKQDLADYKQHLQDGLTAQTITKLVQRNASIKLVSQPYGSFGGRGQENDSDFIQRCSERLRHRNRAVTPWDYEHLILEKFPDVFKVKCLPHSNASAKSKAGETALVIVPDLLKIEHANPLEPRASAVLMERIKDYVNTNLSTPFSKIHVIHPEFERIRVEMHVSFRSGVDTGWYSNVLNEDLRRFLSPWAYRQGEDIMFGGRIYKSEILAFVEGREYVDYVTDFNLYHSYDGEPREGIGQMVIGRDFFVWPEPHPAIGEMVIGDDFIVGRDIEFAYAAPPHAILVSHPQHLIAPISLGEDRCIGDKQLGIGYMTVDVDFYVTPE